LPSKSETLGSIPNTEKKKKKESTGKKRERGYKGRRQLKFRIK
jgi:hypothetical protein